MQKQKDVQRAVSIPDAEWELAKKAAAKTGRSRPRWIERAIREQAKRDGAKCPK